jgi:hypothetical protein
VEGRREDQAVAAEYRARFALRTSDVARLEQRHALLASLRLGMFFLAAVLIALLGRTSAPWLAIPVVAFIPLLFAHARVLNQRDRAARAAAFYERGLARIDERWQGRGERGERFRDPSHLYADDLDLFGAGGLFELLATTRTSGGEDVLAAWLLSPAPPATIRQRQQSLAELAPRLDFREDVAVIGPDVEGVVRSDDLRKWAAAPPQLSGRWPRILLPILAAISTGLVIQWIWTFRPPDLLLPALVAQGVLAYRFRHGVHHVTHGLEQREQELRVLATLMERIESEPLESEGLRAIRDRLRATGRAPADEIRRLARLVEMLSSGHNQIFAPISALLLLGTQLAFAVEHWRKRCGPAVSEWLGAVAECEALTALATYTAEHPHDPFPEIVEGSPSYIGESIAHPLLPAAAAVANDVRMGATDPHLLMVSGSNMSGKSTLLRTIGLNAVLAQAGGPVRARRLVMTPFRIGATLRIQDSLQAGRSRFFAEITRISEIVALQTLAAPSDVRPSVLFLLDELLMGTNSHDRLLGATGILHGLIERGAIGLATTHDLALTRIVDSLAGRAANVHFEDRFENGVLTFDYRLRPGVVRSSNALALMRAVGLQV